MSERTQVRRVMIGAVVLAVGAVPGCQCRKEEGAKVASGADGARAPVKPPDRDVPSPDRDVPSPDRDVPDPGDPPPRQFKLPPAPAPEVATEADCDETGTISAGRTLRAAAASLDVPMDALEAVEKELVAAFVASCKTEKWPAFFLDCIGKSRQDMFTYQRCFDRLPSELRARWNQTMDAIVQKAGGKAATLSEPATGGPTFEEVCAPFVAEVARLDDCNSAGSYVPQIEETWAEGRRIAADGVVPADQVESLTALCAERAIMVQQVTETVCGKLVRAHEEGGAPPP